MSAPAVVRHWAAATAVAVFGAVFMLVGAPPASTGAQLPATVSTAHVVAGIGVSHDPAATLLRGAAVRTLHADRTQQFAALTPGALLVAAALFVALAVGTARRRRTSPRGLPVGRAPPVFAFVQ
jgi:hypothetical protein